MTKQQAKAKDWVTDKFFVSYFRRFAQENERFIIEYEVASEIAAIIASKYDFDEMDFQSTVNCFNRIVGQIHYDGAVWQDLRLRLAWFFRVFGYQASFDAQTDELTIVKVGWFKLIKWRWQSIFSP
ncbi:MAG: hypothetical protein M3Y12_03515 [Bacteroidota bacterium]|nr:hypothetical protein [Bacteroidota bacterium]